jgi:Zn-dependent protease with chaperone function
MNRGVLAVLAAALWLAGGPLQAQQSPEAEDPNLALSGASVTVMPVINGDLYVMIFMTGPHSPDLGPIIRDSLHCDWRNAQGGQGFILGTCHHFLKTDGRSADGWIELAPLTTALHRAGAVDVQLAINSLGHPVPAPHRQWRRQDLAPAAKTLAARHPSQFFLSASDTELPPPFEAVVGSPWQPARLAVPFLLVFFGPALLAFWLRRRMARKQKHGAGVVWLNWILLASWLYWISAVNISDLSAFVASIGIESPWATLFIAAAVYCLPLQVAIASCVVALSAGTPQEVMRTVKQSLTRESALLVPLALFLSGMGLMDRDWRVAMFSWLAAFGAYKGITWLAWRWSFADLRILDVGDLRERAALIGRLAGVELKSVYVLGTRIPREANAFALAGGNMILTRSLLDNLTRREVDSVMAHEVGHLVGKHIGLRTTMFWVYFLVLGPAMAVLIGKLGLPPAIAAIPFAPMIYVMVAARLSQRHEFSADAKSVRLTNDPQGMIAALSRLAQMTHLPVDWGGMQGSILSHPSMRNRILAIAREFGVPDERALELLANPDVLESGPYASQETDSAEEPVAAEPPPHYSVPAHIDDAGAAFTASAKATYFHWAAWVSNGTLLGVLIGLAYLARHFGGSSPWSTMSFLISLPFVACLFLWVSERWQCRFLGKMKRLIAERIPNSADAQFVALLPGDRVEAADGFYAWDLGFLFLDSDRLSFSGEQAKFSVARSDVHSIEIRRGPLAWGRAHAVVLQTSEGSFNFHMAHRGCSGRLARQLERRLEDWWTGASTAIHSAATPDFPAPQLPVLPRPHRSRLRLTWVIAKKTALLFVGALILLMALPVSEVAPAAAVVPFAAPMIYAVIVFPVLLRKNT